MRLLPPAVLVLALVAGCSGGPVETPDRSPTAPPSTSQAVACGLLDAQQREQLTGRPLDQVTDPARAALGLQCRWADGATFIEVSSLDAGAWARSLPNLVSGLRASGRDLDPDTEADLQAIVDLVEGRDALTAGRACDLFPTIAEAVAGDETDAFVLFVPIERNDGQAALGVQAQTCTDGVFSSVVFSAPDVTESDAVERRARTALDDAHRAAIDSGALAV